jgi:hypothetical protein
MTRETKVGMVVATSFLCLIGGVVGVKYLQSTVSRTTEGPAEAVDATSADSKPLVTAPPVPPPPGLPPVTSDTATGLVNPFMPAAAPTAAPVSRSHPSADSGSHGVPPRPLPPGLNESPAAAPATPVQIQLPPVPPPEGTALPPVNPPSLNVPVPPVVALPDVKPPVRPEPPPVAPPTAPGPKGNRVPFSSLTLSPMARPEPDGIPGLPAVPKVDLPTAPPKVDLPTAPPKVDLPTAPPKVDLPTAPPKVDLPTAPPKVDLPTAPPKVDLPTAPPKVDLPTAPPKVDHPTAPPKVDTPMITIRPIPKNDGPTPPPPFQDPPASSRPPADLPPPPPFSNTSPPQPRGLIPPPPTDNVPVPIVPVPGAGTTNPPPSPPLPMGNNTSPPAAPDSRPRPPIELSVDSYEEEWYLCRDRDTFRLISEKFYYSPKYERALLLYNRDRQPGNPGLTTDSPILRGGDRVLVPPARILERRFPAEVSNAAASSPSAPPPTFNDPPRPGTNQPIVQMGTPQALGNPKDPVYRVRGSGETLQEIARRTMGDSRKWDRIFRLNPTLNPNQLIPGGTLLRLPPEANAGA